VDTLKVRGSDDRRTDADVFGIVVAEADEDNGQGW
jgi:hypothetical protein